MATTVGVASVRSVGVVLDEQVVGGGGSDAAAGHVATQRRFTVGLHRQPIRAAKSFQWGGEGDQGIAVDGFFVSRMQGVVEGWFKSKTRTSANFVRGYRRANNGAGWLDEAVSTALYL